MRRWLPWVLGVAVLLALAAWLMTYTEWVEVEIATPAKGEASSNRYYAVQQLLTQLGGDAQKRTHLQNIPPRHARLVLDHAHWDMFEERAETLRQWVHHGGHLVLGGWLVGHKELAWLPFMEASGKPMPENNSTGAAVGQPNKATCTTLTESPDTAAYYDSERSFQYCTQLLKYYVAKPGNKTMPLWQVDGPGGASMLRMPYGNGSVTVLSNIFFLSNRNLLRGDHALLAAAALQAQPGAVYWFVTEIALPPLWRSLWQRFWPALVLAGLALLCFIWRAAVRFGPVLLPPAVHRRSMREQVRGTGRFLYAHGRQALYTAQWRALHEAAEQHVPDWAMMDTTARAAAVARATGLPEAELTAALQSATSSQADTVTLYTLSLLEHARRRLLDIRAIALCHIHRHITLRAPPHPNPSPTRGEGLWLPSPLAGEGPGERGR